MNRLVPDKLTVEYLEGVNKKAPLFPRRYTVTHDKKTQDMFLVIGPEFVYDKVIAVRNDVLGEWLYIENKFGFYVYLHMDGLNELVPGYDESRLMDLLLALQAIRYGDRQLFEERPELDQYSIIVYFLYSDPEQNKAENWGTFADYDISASFDHVAASSLLEYHVLIDEKKGDMNGDGIPDQVSVYADTSSDSDFLHNIIIEAEGGQPGWFKVDMITELNGYHPTLFLGDFTKDRKDDILFRIDKMFNSMNSKDKGEYGASIITFNEKQFDIIFVSDRYNIDYSFLAEFQDFYKISILNVKVNKLFFLDISDKGYEYLAQLYYENGTLIKPVQAMVRNAERFLPVSYGNDNSFDLLAIHRIVGDMGSDILGYMENLLSWNGKAFESICMSASTTGVGLIKT